MVRKTLISIVSPAYNEEKNIPLMVKEVKEVLVKISKKYDFEYILVNDGSADETWKEILKVSSADSRIKGLNLSRQFGHQLALTAGLDHAKGKLVIYCDSDLQQPPALFLKMIKKWEEGYKVVHTLRTSTEGVTKSKKIFSELFYKFINALSDTPIKDGMADFKLLDRKVLLELKKMKEHNRFLRGMVPWIGYKSAIVEYVARPRLNGKPWYNFKRNIDFAKTGILSFSLKPLKYIGYLGIFITFVSGIALFISAILLFVYGRGFLSPTFVLMAFNTFVMGIILSCLGILALYVSYVYQEVINRPLYIISERTF